MDLGDWLSQATAEPVTVTINDMQVVLPVELPTWFTLCQAHALGLARRMVTAAEGIDALNTPEHVLTAVEALETKRANVERTMLATLVGAPLADRVWQAEGRPGSTA